MSEENVRREEFRVRGESLVEKVKELVHEGNIRRVLIVDGDGKTLLDIPLTLGVIGALVAPQLAALGALAALVTDATIVVEIVD
jgi:CBS domain-containing protein